MPSGSRFGAGAEAGAATAYRHSSWPHLLLLRGPKSLAGQTRADAVDFAVPIEQVVGVERNDLARGRHEMDTGAFDVANAEIEAIEELHNGDAKHVFVT